MVRAMAEKTSALEDENAALKAYGRPRFGRRSEKLGSAVAGAEEEAQQAYVFEEIETGIAALKAQTGPYWSCPMPWRRWFRGNGPKIGQRGQAPLPLWMRSG